MSFQMEYLKTPVIRTIQDKVNYHLWKKVDDAAKQLSFMQSRDAVVSFLTIQMSYPDLVHEMANIQSRFPHSLTPRAQPYDVSPLVKLFFVFFEVGCQMINTNVIMVVSLEYT